MRSGEGQVSGASEMRDGWRILAGCFVGVSASFASLFFYTSGIFLKPVAETFGWTRGEISLSSIAVLVGNVLAFPVAGRLVDRFGERRVAFLSTLGLGLSFCLLAVLTTGLWIYLILLTLLCCLSSGGNLIPYNRLLTQHFCRLRGLAFGIALGGTSFGAAILPVYLAPYVAEHGWRAGYLLLGGLTVPLALLTFWLIGRPAADTVMSPRDAGLHWSEVVRHRAFRSIGTIVFLAAAAVLGTTLHVIAMLTDKGMTAAEAGALASGLGVAVLAGRVGAGYLLDRWDAGVVTAVLLALVATGMGALATGRPEMILPAILLVGLGVGTEGDILAYLLGRRFPVRNFGTVYGTILSVHAFGAGLGGFVAGALFDLFGSYQVWLSCAAAMLLVAASIAWLTERSVRPLAASAA